MFIFLGWRVEESSLLFFTFHPPYQIISPSFTLGPNYSPFSTALFYWLPHSTFLQEKGWRNPLYSHPCSSFVHSCSTQNRPVWRKSSVFVRNRLVQPWNQPVMYRTNQKWFECMIWPGETYKPVQSANFVKIGWVLITLVWWLRLSNHLKGLCFLQT